MNISNQIEMVRLEDLVAKDHNYRRFNAIWTFEYVNKQLKKLEKDNPYKGYGRLRLFKCLLLQFMEDLSDCELEKFLQENTADKWFCGLGLVDRTPNFSVFRKLRTFIGTKVLSKIFAHLRDQLKAQGVMNEVFTMVDAKHLIAKATLWKERDEANKAKHEKLNNEVLPKVAVDKQARIGCKGKEKFWYGYKKHVSVDMQSSLINKVAMTPANLTDSQGLKHVCPDQGSIYADKGYCTQPAKQAARRKQCYLADIKKNNMLGKNKDQDRWYSQLRCPYERVFSHQSKRVRYRGIAKNQFAAFMQTISFNLKRLIVLDHKNLQLI